MARTPALDRLGFALSAGPLAGVVAGIVFAPERSRAWIDVGFSAVAGALGGAWQVGMLAYAAVALGLAISPWGQARLGGRPRPEHGTAAWLAMILCTLLAGGGVFWSVAEPVYHHQSAPPALAAALPGLADDPSLAIDAALAQAHLHWGTLAWAVVGTLGAIALSAERTVHGQALRPRALLRPIVQPLMGDGPAADAVGSVVDAVSVIAVVAGTVGPIGFLALQLGTAAETYLGWPNGLPVQLAVLAGLVGLYTASAASGVDRGIVWLSRLNVVLALALGAAVAALGPGWTVLGHLPTSLGLYLAELPTLALNRTDVGWLDGWTVFFWGWFIGYGPLMAVFVARISRGRTVRELVAAVAVGAPLVTHLWFVLLGGTALELERANPGTISGPLADAGLGAALFATADALPGAAVLVPAFVVLIVCFLATTGDSMAYAIAVVQSDDDEPPVGLRIGWAVLMGALAAALLVLGGGGIDALQRMIVLTAAPVSLLLAVTLVTGPLAARSLLRHEAARGSSEAPTTDGEMVDERQDP